MRKLQELPHHLNRSGRSLELFSKVLFNLEWLQAKLTCMSHQSVLDDFEDVLHQNTQHKDLIKLPLDAIRLSASVIHKRPRMLAPQLLGRLLPLCHKQAWIQHLLRQCKQQSSKEMALLPLYHCYQAPGGPLETSFEKHPFAPFGLCFTSDYRFMISASNRFIVKDLKDSENIQESVIGSGGLVMGVGVSTDNTTVIAFTNNSDILIYHISSGLFKCAVVECEV